MLLGHLCEACPLRYICLLHSAFCSTFLLSQLPVKVNLHEVYLAYVNPLQCFQYWLVCSEVGRALHSNRVLGVVKKFHDFLIRMVIGLIAQLNLQLALFRERTSNTLIYII